MGASEAELRRVIVKVLTGEISRAELVQQEPTLQIYAAMALLWAKRSVYLDERYNTRAPFRKLLGNMLTAGVVPSDGRTLPRNGDYFTQKSSAAQLHGLSTNRGLRHGVQLKLPQWLVTLADEHRDHPAVQQFFDDVAAAVALEERRFAAQHHEPLDRAWRDDVLGSMVERAEAEFGLEGVKRLIEIAQRRLEPPSP